MNEMMYLNDDKIDQSKKNSFIERVRDFVKKQKRSKGYTLPTVVGSNTYQLKISGTAKVLLGFTLMGSDSETDPQVSSMKLTINNEVIVDGVNPAFFGSHFTNEGYYFFPRPLNGSDTVELELIGVIAPDTTYMIIYYI